MSMENASLSSIQDERHINISFAPSIKDYALGESIEVENEGSHRIATEVSHTDSFIRDMKVLSKRKIINNDQLYSILNVKAPNGEQSSSSIYMETK